MNPAPEFVQRQQQSVIVTQQFRQSLRILQCSTVELRELLQHELLSNPALEIEEDDQSPGALDGAFDESEESELRSFERYL
ncbi:MAG: hypothetical protein EBZ48_15900, partial [Proteobacteria bacterium]|nr:hypothetical protein [Pseudomonadota bacterium]